ncbi:DUF5983 family protein [Escherichia coli]|uniref:DUF5983 family protein n=1 Tax=Escherichia coli TaxID=562 RepID=UPI0020C815D8|nr:DUF5983 family protein [Escherichia coli]MCP8721319.1 DUF5983 family protein [Escherichia coli]
MKLSVNVEADTINVLALNAGRIAVDIDGIELAALIDVVCDNGYSLRVADSPGKQVIEDPLPLPVRLPGICCSTAHITLEDNQLLAEANTAGNADWIHDTGYGWLLRLNARCHPSLRLKALGFSGACRRLVIVLMKRYGIDILHLDRDGDVLPGFVTFDW